MMHLERKRSLSFPLTFLKEHMGYEGPTEGTRGTAWPVLSQRSQTGLTEHMTARMALVRAVIYV